MIQSSVMLTVVFTANQASHQVTIIIFFLFCKRYSLLYNLILKNQSNTEDLTQNCYFDVSNIHSLLDICIMRAFNIFPYLNATTRPYVVLDN